MTPYYEHAGITIYHGDCREVLPLIPKCDLVVADPPYNCGKDYGIYKDNLSELEYAVMWREIVNLCLSKAVNQFWVAPRYKLKLWLELLPGAHLVVITRSAQGPSRAGGASGDQFEIALACGRPKNQIADLWTDIRLKGEGLDRKSHV